MELVVAFLLGSVVNSSCPRIEIVNETRTWVETDSRSLKSAIERCPIKYPEAPCLKKFWKKEELTYWALCGEKDNG